MLLNTMLKAQGSHFTRISDGGQTFTIEYQWVGSANPDAPLLIFLHEGLGSVSHWGSWPDYLATHLQCRGLVYSRVGYGQSTPRDSHDALETDYLHSEAQVRLPALLHALGLQHKQPIVFGHSDGATIALLYAAMANSPVKAAIVVAPHINVEDLTQRSVAESADWYLNKGLKQRLARYHTDVDSTFWNWCNAWSSERFKDWNIEAELEHIQCPLLLVQGDEDEYASLEQVYGVQRRVPHAELMIMPRVRHVPHIERPEVLRDACATFIQAVLVQQSS